MYCEKNGTSNSNSIISKLLLNFYNFDTKLNKLHFTLYFCTVGPRIQIKGICNNPERLKFKVNRGLGNELAHIISAVDENSVLILNWFNTFSEILSP